MWKSPESVYQALEYPGAAFLGISLLELNYLQYKRKKKNHIMYMS